MPGDSVVIRLPDPRVIRVVARSVFLAVALLCLPWLRSAGPPPSRGAVDACATAAAQAELMLRDLRREGMLFPGARAVVLGADGYCDPSAPKRDHLNSAARPISLRRMLMIGDSSVDFLLDFGYFDGDGDRFRFADRVLKNGGILVAPMGSLSVLSLTRDYHVFYIPQFADTFLGMKKIAHPRDNVDIKSELPSPAALIDGLVSVQLAEAGNGELTVLGLGRKLLLSDITVPSSVLHPQFRIGVGYSASWNARELQAAR